MQKHITAVGILHIGLGALGILLALIILAGTLIPGFIVLYSEADSEPLTILAIIGSSVACFLVVISIPGIIGGIGVLKLWPWARYLVLILAVLHLFNIPIGTLAGVYSIWVLIQDETAQIFARGKEDQVSLTTAEP